MTVYVTGTFRCPPATADLMGLRQGERVAHLRADRPAELWVFAADLGLPDKRMLGGDTPLARYVVTGLERNQAIVRGAEPGRPD